MAGVEVHLEEVVVGEEGAVVALLTLAHWMMMEEVKEQFPLLKEGLAQDLEMQWILVF